MNLLKLEIESCEPTSPGQNNAAVTIQVKGSEDIVKAVIVGVQKAIIDRCSVGANFQKSPRA